MQAKIDYDKLFEERLKRLNKGQKQAVEAIDGPVMVIAGPGTGKTTILTLRIANILKKTDTPPSGILAITFTDAGVRAMKAKLRDIIGARADEVKIHTFHSFASSVIAEYQDHFVHMDRTRQMTDIDAEALIRKILTSSEFSMLRPLGNPDFYISPILSGIRDAKREDQSPEMVARFAQEEKERIQNDESMISTRGATKGELKGEAKKRIEKCEKTEVFAKVYEQYEKQKKAQKLKDYDDLIFELLTALRNDQLLLRMLQEKYLYLLVDEHQDTNDSQNGIIKLLAEFFDTPNVFIVGDEKQAIFRFQGASVKNFLRFKDAWKNITTISLEENYRSHQDILDASFKMIESNYDEGEFEDLRVKLLSRNGDEAHPIEVVQTADSENGEAYLVDEIKRITAENPAASIALITRTNKDVERLIRLCQSQDIEVAAERSIDVFSHPIGVAFFSLIDFLHDHSHLDSLSKTLSIGMWELSFEDAAALIKKLYKGETADVTKALPALRTIKQEFRDDSPISSLIHTAEVSGFIKLLVADPTYVEVWRAILGLAESIVKADDIHDTLTLIERLLAYKTSAQQKSVKVQVGVPDVPVHIMTAHGSKGLEFDYVFIPYAIEESWSSRPRSVYFLLKDAEGDDEDSIRDARRLFYVALTRAKKHAVLIVAAEDTSGTPLSPLRFIEELDEKSLSYITIPKQAPRKVLLSKKTRSEIDRTKILEYAKRTLVEGGLSVTALNHFLECPSKFIYRSVLKVPELPNPKAEGGNAMHAAFDHIWRESDKSVEHIQSIIESTVEEHINQAFLPSYEKQKVKEELFKNAPAVAKSLHPHFNLDGKHFTESWTEMTFAGEKSDILIRGKLDAIVDTKKEIQVFDYKTKGKMSVNEIKGETKNSDGNYFRQLAFYKLLLENDSRFKGRTILTSLVFVTPDAKGNCHIETLPVERADIEKVKEEINSLINSVWSGDILDTWCDDPKCECCALKKLI
jgi:DNA helicase-2/ATP-dependent DNA helicase PcrA